MRTAMIKTTRLNKQQNKITTTNIIYIQTKCLIFLEQQINNNVKLASNKL